MNKSLKDIIRAYPVLSQPDFRARLDAMAQPELAKNLEELLTMYYNDLNSSTLREAAVVLEMGFEPIAEKIGYNGYRIESPTGHKTFCEVKPKNVRADGDGRKLDGGGNFTDYSWQKFQRHKEEDPVMLVAGFVDGKIVYIFQFPFNTAGFVERIEEQLQRHFPEGDKEGVYLRSASFGFKHYEKSPKLQTRCFVSKQDLEAVFKDKITAPVRDHLRKFSDE